MACLGYWHGLPTSFPIRIHITHSVHKSASQNWQAAYFEGGGDPILYKTVFQKEQLYNLKELTQFWNSTD